MNVWPEAPEDLPKAIDEAVELRTALPSTGQFYQFPKMMEFEINNGVAIAIQKGRIVQKSELSEMIAKVHDHIEGRYEIDSYDLGIIQSMLCELQPSGNSGELENECQQCAIKDERIRELEETLQYARNKTYILVHTKNAVSKTCQRDLLKMRDKIDSTIGKLPGRL